MSGNGHRIVVTESDQRLMDFVLSGEWSVDDAIEAGIDEVSTAVNVGSGPDRPLGYVRPKPFRDDALEKILREFEDYLRKHQRAPTAAEIYNFAESRALPESVEVKLRAWIRRRR